MMPCSPLPLGHGGPHHLRLARHRHLRLPLGLMLVQDTLDILPQSADDLQRRHAAVADGGVHIVHGVEAELVSAHWARSRRASSSFRETPRALQLRLEALAGR